MPEKPDPAARLIAETFNGDWTEGAAAGLARAAAARARRRRRVRQVAGGSAVVVVLCLIVTVFVSRRVERGATSSSARPTSAPVARTSPAFETISDAELFEALRTHPLLILPQQPLDRRYIVLKR